MSNYCIFNDNGIKNIEQITFWRRVEKDPHTILFMTPSGVYLYTKNNIVKSIDIITTTRITTHEFYKYYASSLETWLVSIDTGDHKKWKLVDNIESIHLHY